MLSLNSNNNDIMKRQNIVKMDNRIEKIYNKFSFSDTLRRYNRHLKLEKNQSIFTRYSKLERLNYFFNRTRLDPLKVTKDDLLDFLENKEGSVSTLNSYKQAFYCFFKWLGKEDIIKGIKIAKKEKLKDHDVVSKEDFDKMVRVIKEYHAPELQILRNITLLSFLYFCGMRVGELIDIKKDDVVFDNIGIKIKLTNEKINGQRYNRILKQDCNLISDIKKYFDMRNWDRNHVFVPLRTDSETMSGESVNQILKTAARKANISKNIHSHIFRHSRATKMAKNQFNESFMRIWFGWKKKSDMPSYYSHLVHKDVDKVLLKGRGLLDSMTPQSTISKFT